MKQKQELATKEDLKRLATKEQLDKVAIQVGKNTEQLDRVAIQVSKNTEQLVSCLKSSIIDFGHLKN